MTMLYNGMEFPILPKRDGYPCAVIYGYCGDASLVLFSEPNKVDAEKLAFWGVGIGWVQFELVDGEWAELASGFDNFLPTIDAFIWANYDVLDRDGNVYLAASEPLTLFLITHTIHADLLERGVRPRIDVVQGDSLTRRVEFILTAGGVPWAPPDDTTAALSYVRPDGVGKVYDKLDDGSTAYTVSGNRVRMMLLPEVMEVAGDVMAALRIVRDTDGKLLSSFAIDIAVEPEPSYMVRPPTDEDNSGEDQESTASLYLYGRPSESGNIGVRVGDSVTYYDGAVLADINTVLTDDMKSEYPAAVISIDEDTGEFYLSTHLDVTYKAPCVDNDGYTLLTYAGNIFKSVNGQWGEASKSNAVKVIWSNVDIGYASGIQVDEEVYLYATDPIPVSGIVDYIDEIPVYEVKL